MIFHCRLSAALSSGLVLAALLWTGASAEDSERIGHFATADGDLGFVLDLSGETPRQRFDNSPEILVLKPVAAARGDTIYKGSGGEQVLRMNPYGGLTYFAPGDQMGVPMVRMGDGQALEPKMRSSAEVLGLGVLIEQQMLLNHNLTVTVTTPRIDELKQQRALNTLGDAIENAQIALDRITASPAGANDLLGALSKIDFNFARTPGVLLRDGVLSIRCTPSLQLSGRPSSFEIANEIQSAIREQSIIPAGIATERAPKPQHSYDYRW